MLLSRAAVIRQSDGFAKLQRLCHTLIFAIFFLYTPFCQLSCVIFRLYFMFFSFFFGGFNKK